MFETSFSIEKWTFKCQKTSKKFQSCFKNAYQMIKKPIEVLNKKLIVGMKLSP